MAKRQALGRGIGALVKEVPKAAPPPEAPSPDSEGITRLPLKQIKANPGQPRRIFDDAALKELTASIKEHGVLQPLLFRPKGKTWQIIAGERRLRAATAAEQTDIPVIILDIDDQQALEIALIENLQRDDLNLIETAEGYKELTEKFGLTQDQIAKRVGKARASIANLLRLLDLPAAIRKMLQSGQLSAGHGKVLLGVDIDAEKEQLAARVVRETLSVRALEKIVEKIKSPPEKPRTQKSDLPTDYIRHLSETLHQHFGTAVRIHSTKTLANGKKGQRLH